MNHINKLVIRAAAARGIENNAVFAEQIVYGRDLLNEVERELIAASSTYNNGHEVMMKALYALQEIADHKKRLPDVRERRIQIYQRNRKDIAKWTPPEYK